MKKRRIVIVTVLTVLSMGITIMIPNMATATVPGNNTLLNKDTSGTYGNLGVTAPGVAHANSMALSGDGRYAVFSSRASNLVASDTNGYADVFVKDLQNGSVVMASLRNGGYQIGDSSFAVDVSHDGRYVLFGTWGLVTSAFTYSYHLYMRDMVNNTTTLVDQGSNTNTVNYSLASMSEDGRYVAFTAERYNASNNIHQIYVRDMLTGAFKEVSVDSTGLIGQGVGKDSLYPSINCSGNIIAFSSKATNLPNNTAGLSNLFIAEIGWSTTNLINATLNGSSGISINDVQVSCDGNIILYQSQNISSGSAVYYKYNRITGQKTLVSATSGGVAVNYAPSAVVSGDGRYVAFSAKGNNIDPSYASTTSATNYDIYLRDTKLGTTQLVTFNVSGDRGGNVPQDAHNLDISHDGSKVIYRYITPASTDPARSLVSGLTTGTSTTQHDAYVSETGL